MSVFLLIVQNVILPVFSLIGVGAFLHRKFKLDMNTLSKLNTFLLMPFVSFENIYKSKIGADIMLSIVCFLVLQSLCLILLSTGISKLAKFNQGLSVTFKNSVVLYNSGNFGLPVSQLVFQNNPIGLSIQVVVTIFQSLLTFTYGFMNAASVNNKGLDAIKTFLKNPIFFAVLLGILLNALHIQIPAFLWTPVENVSDAFLALALITLGAQSAYLKITLPSLPLCLSLIGRLLLSPALALVLIFTMQLEGTTAQALFIASSYPTSRNSALFALEYGDHAEYAAQAVLLSTMLSSITVAFAVYLSHVLW